METHESRKYIVLVLPEATYSTPDGNSRVLWGCHAPRISQPYGKWGRPPKNKHEAGGVRPRRQPLPPPLPLAFSYLFFKKEKLRTLRLLFFYYN